MKSLKYLYIVIIITTFSACKKEVYTDAEKQERTKAVDDFYNIMRQNEVYSFTADDEDMSNCKKGTLKPEIYTMVLNSLNYYRKLAGCSELLMDSSFNSQCQAFILTSLANKGLTNLTPSAKCYSDEANNAWGTVISSSSYYTNASGPITHFIIQEKYEDNIKDVVNRRWLLYPKLDKVGYGQFNTFFGVKINGENTINQNNPTPEYVAWPPKGFLMRELMPKIWSFTMLNADFSNASVSLKVRDLSESKNKSISKLPMKEIDLIVNNKSITTHGDDFSILWRFDPPKIDDKYKDEDIEYEVSIKNVSVNGVNKDFNYKVFEIRKK